MAALSRRKAVPTKYVVRRSSVGAALRRDGLQSKPRIPTSFLKPDRAQLHPFQLLQLLDREDRVAGALDHRSGVHPGIDGVQARGSVLRGGLLTQRAGPAQGLGLVGAAGCRGGRRASRRCATSSTPSSTARSRTSSGRFSAARAFESPRKSWIESPSRLPGLARESRENQNDAASRQYSEGVDRHRL